MNWHADRKRFLTYLLLTLSFSVLSLILGQVRFMIPAMGSLTSSLNEVGVLISVFYLPHWSLVAIVGMASCLSAPSEILLVSLMAHATIGIVAFFFYQWIRGRFEGVVKTALIWAAFVFLYYILLLPFQLTFYRLTDTSPTGSPWSDAVMVMQLTNLEMITTSLIISLYSVTRYEIMRRVVVETAFRNSEARIHSVFKVAPVGIGVFSNKNLVWFNERLCQITGYSEDEMKGKGSKLLFPDQKTHDETWNVITQNLTRSETCTVEALWRTKSGKNLHMILNLAPFYTSGKSDLTFTALDVTDRKLLEEQFRQAQKMEAIGQLAGGVAHDFNNLLTVISGYTDMILFDNPQNGEIQKQIEPIRQAAARAKNLIRQLMAFSRKEAARPRAMDINEVITGSVDMLGHLIGKGIQIKTDLMNSLSPIFADPNQIEQIIVNLVVNARDAIEEKGGSKEGIITVMTKKVILSKEFVASHMGCMEGPRIALMISDTGVGMNGETLRRIYEPFFTTKPEGKGSGLGLATVYGLVKQNNGNVYVDSEPGAGTTFSIYLPPLDLSAEPA